jgi:hypothetical protein
MANNNNPHGLRPLGISLSGAALYFDILSKLAGYGTAIFVYDAVNRVSGGALQASATPGTTAYSGVSMNYGPASTATDHTVLLTPDAMYEAQDDGTTGNGNAGVVAIDLGLNANLVLSAGGATSPHLSGHQIAKSTAATTATLDAKLVNILNVPDNAFGPNCRVEIVFNKHRGAPGVAGV